MKKRLRKKLHKGEFQQYGISIWIPVTTESVEATLDTITDIADSYKLLFCGGGLGRFVLPAEKYGDLEMPSKIEYLIMSIALEPEILLNGIIGYFINPTGIDIPVDMADKLKIDLEKVLTVDFKINCRIGLWK
ncbi:MAG: 50S ribosome-binding protein YggL [Bacteroides sp.]|nr:50S ribosome-binding protein YggL [Bacteroides sp.]